MSTERQRESARINGARFRGPVTAEGKQISSRNSTRHGLLAQTVVHEGESLDRFQELLDGLIAEFQPRSTAETVLVETMVIARRRYLRILSFHKVQFDLEIAREASPSPKPVRAALAFRKLSVNSRSLDLLLRYETAFDRQFSRALSTLLKLRAQSPAPPPAEQPELPNEPNFPADPPLARPPSPPLPPAGQARYQPNQRPPSRLFPLFRIFRTNRIPRRS